MSKGNIGVRNAKNNDRSGPPKLLDNKAIGNPLLVTENKHHWLGSMLFCFGFRYF
jgi:hypothetical protein